MPNEFVIKNGLIVSQGGASITGSITVTGGITGSFSGESDPIFTSVSGSLVTTASFNAFTSSYYLASASFVSNIFKERRYDSSGSYSYCGTAPQSSPEASNVWSITRIFISSSGNTTIASASIVDWTNRYTHTYY